MCDPVFFPSAFELWFARVDRVIDRITGGVGMTHADFNDWHFASAFDDGMAPIDAAMAMLAEDETGRSFLEAIGIDPESAWL
jgi:molybdopterin-biosynthesis enzyme MoeA-like protein